MKRERREPVLHTRSTHLLPQLDVSAGACAAAAADVIRGSSRQPDALVIARSHDGYQFLNLVYVLEL